MTDASPTSLDEIMTSTRRYVTAHAGVPDFAAVVQRAQELDSRALTWPAPDHAAEDTVAVDDTPMSPRLAAFVASARRNTEQMTLRRRLQPLPAWRRAPARVTGWAVGVVAAAAAVVLLLLGEPASSFTADRDDVLYQAWLNAGAPGDVHEGSVRTVATSDAVSVTPTLPRDPTNLVVQAGVEPTENDVRVDPTASEEPDAEQDVDSPANPQSNSSDSVDTHRGHRDGTRVAAQRSRSRATRHEVSHTKLEDRLRELDAKAQTQWRAGQLRQAEETFADLTRLAGQSQLGDLAYGDRFTLARQMKQPQRELALWREYLRRFPNGRFADDVRASLCRREDDRSQHRCWRDYLTAYPDGAHAAQAARFLSSPTKDMP